MRNSSPPKGQRNQVLDVLNRISQALGAIGDLPQTLGEIAQSAQAVLSADIVDLYQYHQAHHEFVLPPILVGERRDPTVRKTKIYDDDVVVKFLKLGTPRYFHSSQSEDMLTGKFEISRADVPKQRFVVREGIKSSAVVPLVAANETVGVMFVNYRALQEFDDEQTSLIESFANLAAIAIHKARLFEQQRQSEILRQVMRIVNQTLTLGEVVKLVLEQLRNVIEYNSASVQLVQGDHRSLVGGQGFVVGERREELHRDVSKDPLIYKIVQERKPLVVRNVKDEPLWSHIPETAHVNSWIGAPLTAKDQVIGLLTLDHEQPYHYTQKSGELVAAFGDQVATAIYNSLQAQALPQLNHLTQQLVAIKEPPPNVRSLLEHVAESALKVLQAEVVDLYEYRQDKNEFVLPPIAKGERRGPEVPKEKIKDDDVIIQLIRHTDPLYVQDVRTHEIFASSFVDRPKDLPQDRFVVREGIRSTAFFPLRTGSETVGFMFVSYRTLQRFTPEQRELIELFANQAAIAIKNTRLMVNLKRQAHGHKALNEVSARLTRTLDEEEILSTVARAAADTLDCTHCSVFRLDGDSIIVAASEGNRGESVPKGRSFKLGQGIAGWVAQEKKPALVFDTHNDERFERGWSYPQSDPRSLVVIPALVEDKLYGVISAEQDRPGAFDERDLQLLQTLASQVSQAVRNARLYQHVSQQQQAMQKIVETIGASDDPLPTILEQVAQLFHAQYGLFALVDASAGQLIMRALWEESQLVVGNKFRPA